jgi:hypothetical protein
LGIRFHWASAKWVKRAWGQPTKLPAIVLEPVVDGVLIGATCSFLAGIGCFLKFIVES